MTAPEPIQSHQPQSMFSTWIGVMLLFAFFGLLALVVLRAAPRGDNYETKRAEARVKKLEAAQKQSLTALTTYGWVDKTKGVARIPVTEAMKLTVAELAEKKPAPANPIATPEPVAAPATSPAAAASGRGHRNPGRQPERHAGCDRDSGDVAQTFVGDRARFRNPRSTCGRGQSSRRRSEHSTRAVHDSRHDASFGRGQSTSEPLSIAIAIGTRNTASRPRQNAMKTLSQLSSIANFRNESC